MKRLIIALALLATPLHAEEIRVPNWAVINKGCSNPDTHCLARRPERYKDSDPEHYLQFTKPAKGEQLRELLQLSRLLEQAKAAETEGQLQSVLVAMLQHLYDREYNRERGR